MSLEPRGVACATRHGCHRHFLDCGEIVFGLGGELVLQQGYVSKHASHSGYEFHHGRHLVVDAISVEHAGHYSNILHLKDFQANAALGDIVAGRKLIEAIGKLNAVRVLPFALRALEVLGKRILHADCCTQATVEKRDAESRHKRQI